MLNFGIVDVAGGVGPLVGIRPAQRHVAHTETIEIAQQVNVILDGMPALDAHQGSELFLLVGALDLLDGIGHHHAIGMTRRLLVDRIDQVQCMLREVSSVGCGIDPDGEELRSQISAAGLVKADVADVFRIGRADIVSSDRESAGACQRACRPRAPSRGSCARTDGGGWIVLSDGECRKK
jgi:hypothetical protein